LFKRWAILYLHDGSPLDGAVFVQKPTAEKMLRGLVNKHKLYISEVYLAELKNGRRSGASSPPTN